MDHGPLPRTIAAFMRRLRQRYETGSSLRRTLASLSRPGVAAIVTLGVAWGLVMHQMGWAQMAHFDQVQAFDKGQAQIDQWHWDTNDKAWVDGHFYSVKSPGMAALTTPLYAAIKGLGGDKLARAAVDNADQTAHPKWVHDSVVPLENYGYNVERGHASAAGGRGVDPDRLGAHPAGGRDPGDPAAARRCAGRPTASCPATAPPRRSHSAWRRW